MMNMSEQQRRELEAQILERFLRYTAIDTQSDEMQNTKPTTQKQWDMIHLLERELEQIGIKDQETTDDGFLIARIPSNIEGPQPPAIGFMAHVDTAGDLSGKDVKPQVIESYDGSVIRLGNEYSLDPADNPHVLDWVGKTVITTDGTTLLGADDKAGVAEIMSAAAYLNAHPEIKHGEIEIVFTCDEETGHGMDNFPLSSLKSRCCYTMDGGQLGEIEYECFNAYKAELTFTGVMYHPGAARGRMVNALTMASQLCSMLPQSESPEATDGRYGYYYLHAISGDAEKCSLVMNLRDFDAEGMKRRQETVRAIAQAVEAAYPGGKISIEFEKQYANMKEPISEDPLVMDLLKQVVLDLGIQPIEKPIRGGTDGSRLSEMGIPSPNIFTGGMNFHSRYEWIALPAMGDAVSVILNLIEAWGNQRV
jgi:tripeptide aminopeptidase